MLDSIVPITIDVRGFKFTFRIGREYVDVLKQIAVYVEQKMDEVEKNYGEVTTTKVAILTALIIAMELFELRKKAVPADKQIDYLIDQIDQLLAENKE